MNETKTLVDTLRLAAEEIWEEKPGLRQLLLDAAENLDHFEGHMPCPYCEQSGTTGNDYFGEAIECRYCDAEGRIKAEDVKDLKDRFQGQTGDYMVCDHALGELLAVTRDISLWKEEKEIWDMARAVYGSDRELPETRPIRQLSEGV